MGVDIRVPSAGESVTEGTIARWLKKDGESVRADEPVFELETDKATGEVAAPASGTLIIGVPAGETVAVGSVVGRIEESNSVEPAKPTREKPKSATPGSDGLGRPAKSDAKVAAAATRPAPERPMSPAARRLAREQNKDRRVETPPEASPVPPSGERQNRQRMSTIRQRIAERLVASQQTTATLTTFNEADMSAVIAFRKRYGDRFKEKHGIGLGFMPFFVKASIEALRAFPNVNARIDGTDIVYHDYYHIGVAVSTERGLMVPVIRHAETLSFAEIEKRIAESANAARDGKIKVDDLQGGTFTITNGGVFGSLLSTPILNPPQTGILGMHTIQQRPVAVDNQVVIRPMMYLALSYDHRLVDGREAVQFLVRVKECIENPERMLLEV
jgi:2-oxoglutarate dehydrogenase E2 component (dihydrolipoamide succinyltransferase)